MRVSTLIFTTLFIILVAHGEYDIPGKDFARRLCPSKKGAHKNSQSAQCLKEVDQRIDEIESIVKRLDRSEKALTQRLKEIRRSDLKRRSRSAGDDPFGEKALLRQLKDLQVEQESAVASLERLKSERVRIKVRQDVLQTSAERRTIEGFLDETSFGRDFRGPVDELADDLSRRASNRSGEQGAAAKNIDYEVF